MSREALRWRDAWHVAPGGGGGDVSRCSLTDIRIKLALAQYFISPTHNREPLRHTMASTYPPPRKTAKPLRHQSARSTLAGRSPGRGARDSVLSQRAT